MTMPGPNTAQMLMCFAIACAALPAQAVEASRIEFGRLTDGTSIEVVELSNSRGVAARIMTLGAALQSLSVPDRYGKSADVVLGHATPAEYLEKRQYFGATVGRFANRIRGGQFTLDGRHYTLETNDGPNHLHGGLHGLDKAVWKLDSVSNGKVATVVMSHTSPAGAGGYPGTVNVTATYSLNDANELSVTYQATTDQPTVINISNHSYFNLAGEAGQEDILAHRLTLLADAYTPVDATLIPTGERRNVAGTPFDFREPMPIGSRVRDGRDEQIRVGRGYDHNYVLRGEAGILRLVVRLEHPGSGRVLEILTTAPGIQFYSGNFLDGTTVGKSGRIYRQGDGLCLEPQVFPDAPNRPDFPSARLNPAETYSNTVVYRFPAPQP